MRTSYHQPDCNSIEPFDFGLPDEGDPSDHTRRKPDR